MLAHQRIWGGNPDEIQMLDGVILPLPTVGLHETKAAAEFEARESPFKDRCIGALVGLAIGDALGTTLEFCARDTRPFLTGIVGGGPFNLKPGEWTDDTSMALCLAESLLHDPHLDAADLMGRWLRWYREGYNSCTGHCFDIGTQTREALARWEKTRKLPPNTNGAGNGSIMRLAPVVIRWHEDEGTAMRLARLQSSATHNNTECVKYAGILASTLFHNIHGMVARTPGPSGVPREQVKSTGYVLDTFDASMWAVANTQSFKDALILAVNLGDDADTVGAVTGQIAGSLYGLSGIPSEWLAKLVWKDKIISLADQLYEAGRASG